MNRSLLNQKGVFALLLVLFMGMGTAYAYNFSKQCSTGQWLYYNIINSTNHYVEITYPGTSTSNPWGGYTQPSGNITLPSTVSYNGVTYTVTKIGNYAFYQCGDLTGSLTIPNTVTSIGNHAFDDCCGFTGTLTLSNTLTTIGNYAFNACYMPGYNPTSFTGSLTIPNSVVSIGECAFYYSFCSSNTGTLTLGNNVNSIGPEAFAACSGFTGSLTIPNSVTSIGWGAFDSCEGFSGTLTIGTDVTSIGWRAFNQCSFSQVNFNAIYCSNVEVDDMIFDGWGGTLTIGSSVQKIPDNLFNYSHFSKVNFNATNCILSTAGPSNMVGPGSPFRNCTGTLNIGSNVSWLIGQLFYECGFTQVNFNAINCQDATPGYSPFLYCHATLTIGSNVARIPAYMFENCHSFTGSLSIPSSVNEIGNNAFYGCTNFDGSLTLYDNLNAVGSYAFYNCNKLVGSLTIPGSVSSLNAYAFAHCSSLTSLTIGNSMSSINYGAFYGCTNLSSITVLAETPPSLGSSVFYNVPKSIPVYVPCSAMEDYQTTYGWNEFTNYQCNPRITVMAVPTAGGSVSGGGNYSYGASCTVTANPNSGYAFMNWSKDGTVVSCNASYTFTATEDVELEAAFVSQSYLGDIIGEGTSNSYYLPSYSYYNYSLTEQIYTATEMGGSRTIYNISFFNTGATKTRYFDIYMKHTTKTSFSNNTDWISVTTSNKVFSGSVTMLAGLWTTIELDTPFSYNGSSNLVLVVDDNTGGYTSSPHMACRTYTTSNSQAIRIYSDGTNYDPSSPSSYSGTRLTEKNQIMLNRPASMYDIYVTSANTTAGTVTGGGRYGFGDVCSLKATANSGYTFVDWSDNSGVVVSTDANYTFTVTKNMSLTANFISGTDVCSLTFELFDSYGDGWNGNRLVLDFDSGMTKQLTIDSGSKATFTLPAEYFDVVNLSWIMGNWTQECSFVVSDPEGVKYVGSNLNEYFELNLLLDCQGDSELTYLGNHSEANNQYLPSFSYYCYSLTEQIYTADEIGASGLINSISFYNNGMETKTRNLNIYLATTTKTAFDSQTDWISTNNAQVMFGGTVTMDAGKWTTIVFYDAFDYDGVSNLVLIVDDNTGDYTSSPHMSCRVYPANGFQTHRIYSDNTNYNPSDPSGYTGTLMNVKNQIYLNIVPCDEPYDLSATNITATTADIDWTSSNYNFLLQYRLGASTSFESGLGGWTTIDADGDGHNWTTLNEFSEVYPYYSGMNLEWKYEGDNAILSGSYVNGVGALNPDNYLVSPRVTLGGTISFWAAAADLNYPSDHFGVFVSTGSGTNPSDFVEVESWTMVAKDGGRACESRSTRDGGSRDMGNWYYYEVDLSAYSGQGYIAIRHYNTYDEYILCVDDIIIEQPGIYHYWTSLYNVSHPFTLTYLLPDTQYEVRVRSNCLTDDYSDYVYITFSTVPETVTQTVALSSGYNWFSANVGITLQDLKAALVAALPGTTITINSQGNGSTTYNGTTWRGTLTSLNLSQMYMINVTANTEFSLEGLPINPAEHPATIHPDFNWMAFPLRQSMTLTNAFTGFVINGDMVTSQGEGSSTYTNRWRGSLDVLEPGKGYMYKSAATSGDRTFTFPASAK